RIAGALAEQGASAVRSTAAVGGGGAPGVLLDSAAVALPSALAAPLRALDPAVVGHVERGRLLLDLIAVPADLDDVVVEAVRRVAKDG
ncbi:MAG TPA: L-seryl-tRNA(Sec) selenium transferase, partial [Kribbella sp.]